MPLTLAISTNTSPREHLHHAVYRFARKGLYKVIELQIEHAARDDYSNPQVIKALTLLQRDYGIEFQVHGPYVSPDLANLEEVKRKLSVEKIKNAIEFSSAFEARILTIHTGRGKNSVESFDQLCRSVDELVLYAEPYEISVCVETAGREGLLLLSIDEYSQLCDRTGCRLTIDLPHLMTTSAEPDNFLGEVAKLIPLADNAHISDTFVPYHLHQPIGYGNFVSDRLISFLCDRGYCGRIVIDAAEKGFSPDQYQTQGVAFCESLPDLLTLG